VDFVDVRLQAPRGAVSDLRDFYLDRLGFHGAEDIGNEFLVVPVGSAMARFSEAPTPEEPFYHFALLVPGDRFEAAYKWLGARAQLIPDPESDDTIFDFHNWDALACYCLDPAGNIVELIAHRGISERSSDGPFDAQELVGFSEVGLVVPDKEEAVSSLGGLGLSVWDGEIADPDRLVFVGERAKTLILSRPGRGWLPTGRFAEAHPVELVVRGTRRGEAQLPDTSHHVVSV
jgi:catechol 2,3-dioxygenase-like lactoylglutathione lyase family enzyme